MRTYLTTTAALAALACPLPAIPAAAQEEATVAEALEALEQKKKAEGAWNWPYDPATDILRQVSGPRPAAEIDEFADRVAEIAAVSHFPRT